MKGLTAYHGELAAKKYKYMNPGIEERPAPSSLELAVIDPFENRITLPEQRGCNVRCCIGLV